MRFILILTALTLLMGSCISNQKRYEKQLEKCQKWNVCPSSDSISIIETETTDTILLDQSEMWFDFLFECDSNGQVLAKTIDNLQTENVNLKMQLKNNRLVVYVEEPNDPIYVHGSDRVEYHQKVVEKKVNELTFWQQLQMYGFWVVLCLLLLFVFISRVR